MEVRLARNKSPFRVGSELVDHPTRPDTKESFLFLLHLRDDQLAPRTHFEVNFNSAAESELGQERERTHPRGLVDRSPVNNLECALSLTIPRHGSLSHFFYADESRSVCVSERAMCVCGPSALLGIVKWLRPELAQAQAKPKKKKKKKRAHDSKRSRLGHLHTHTHTRRRTLQAYQR